MSARLPQVKRGLASEGDVRFAESLCSTLFHPISVKDHTIDLPQIAGILKINFKNHLCASTIDMKRDFRVPG